MAASARSRGFKGSNSVSDVLKYHLRASIIKTVREWVFPGKTKMFECFKQAVLMVQDAVDVPITLC
jgi:hypothetical protein